MANVPEEFRDFPDHMRVEFGPYRSVVKRIVDGDTFWCLTSLGFDDYRMMRLRIAAVDCPEMNRAATAEAGKAARDYAATLIPVGSPLIVFTEPDRDNFGRYVARVMMADGRFLEDALVEAGHAVRVIGY